MVNMNGFMVESLYGRLDLSDDSIVQLEAKTSEICSKRIAEVSPAREGLQKMYEPLARVHMLW